MRELAAGGGAEDDRSLTDRVVDRKDLRTAAYYDRQPAELVSLQMRPALFVGEREY
jgi:hypothetical protein